MLQRVAAAALVFAAVPAAIASSTPHHRTALVARDGVILRATPAAHGQALATLVQQTQVEVLHEGKKWDEVRVWASATGWLSRRDLTYRPPWTSVSTYHAPVVRAPIRSTAPAAVDEPATLTQDTILDPAPNRSPVARLPAGTHVTVTAWQQDAAGTIWYRVRGRWASGASVQLTLPLKAHAGTHNAPIWASVAGKGMWLTLGTISGTDPSFLVNAARADGITHLYLESAISPLGFHGRGSVGPLLDAAHRAHLHVIAWVYPYLRDIAADVALTRQVAAFRTASGNMFDGIAADLESNISQDTVRAYSQLVRLYLGPSYLLIGVTYPPQSFPAYPFAEAALRYNVLAPMDYWHETQTKYGTDFGHLAYGEEYGRRYAETSVSLIHQAAPTAVVAPIGQTFDDFGRLEMGPNAPTAAEIRGFCAGAKASGAVGVSFFQWMTATRDEFQAIHDFSYQKHA